MKKRVQFITSISAAEGSYTNGESADLPVALADCWVRAGVCIPAEAAPSDPVPAPSDPVVAPVATETPIEEDKAKKSKKRR